jgi:NCS1 family nucleobase:cation symporter-1
LAENTKDKPISVEKYGIEHIPEEARHGSPTRVFTLWFAANLTVADYVIGVLCTLVFGLTVSQALPVLILGNLLGGLFVGLSAAMGPSLGFPQMYSSRSSFGRRGNYVPGALNWISTVGWFTVNTILAAEAVQVLIPSASFAVSALVLVALQVVIAVYGHDFIHLFEKVMSIVLGLLFLWIFVLAIPHLNEAMSFVPAGGSAGALTLGSAAIVLAVSFSYLMSWSPYASDYSRYLPSKTSRRSVFVMALAGGAIASFGVEAIGSIVGSITRSLDYFGALNSFAGGSGWVAMLAIIMGAAAANALNIYTNSLSALVLDVRVKRWVTVVVGGIVGLALALITGAQFERFFENFLLALTYWITPWLAIVLVDFYIKRRTSVETTQSAPAWIAPVLAIYLVSILISVPFMNNSYYVGSFSPALGGADFSYFVSFAVAAVLALLYRQRPAAILPNAQKNV